MRLVFIPLLAALLAGCLTPGPHVDPAAAGRPAAELGRLVAGSEAWLFPCSIQAVAGDRPLKLAGLHTEVTLVPGRYRVTLRCASSAHYFEPQTDLIVRPGHHYRLVGFLVDDSITVFSMKMRIRAEERPG